MASNQAFSCLDGVRAVVRDGWAGWKLAKIPTPHVSSPSPQDQDWVVLDWHGEEGPATCWLVVWRDGTCQLRLDRGQMFPLPRVDDISEDSIPTASSSSSSEKVISPVIDTPSITHLDTSSHVPHKREHDSLSPSDNPSNDVTSSFTPTRSSTPQNNLISLVQSLLECAAEQVKQLPLEFKDVPGRDDLVIRGDAAFRRLGEEKTLIGPVVGAIRSRTEADLKIIEDPVAFGGHWIAELLEAQPVKRRHTDVEKCITISDEQLDMLRTTGLLVMPNALDAALVATLRDEAREMSLARSAHGQHPSVRSDKVAFVEFGESDDLEHAFAILEDAGAQVGSWRGAPLMRPTQGMVSLYGDSGAHYAKHFDNERDRQGFWRNHRVLTALLYLSDEGYSCALHGGELVAEDTNATTHSIDPTPGTLVLFDSRAIEHTVMPIKHHSQQHDEKNTDTEPDSAPAIPIIPHAQRYAVSLWFVATTMLESDPLPPSGIKSRPPPIIWEPTRILKSSESDDGERPAKIPRVVVSNCLTQDDDQTETQESTASGFSFNFLD